MICNRFAVRRTAQHQYRQPIKPEAMARHLNLARPLTPEEAAKYRQIRA
jgi:hypothetical protein